MEKNNTYKVTLTLKSGIVRVHKIKATETKLTDVLQMVDKVWMGHSEGGYVQFSGHFYNCADISHYRAKKVWF